MIVSGADPKKLIPSANPSMQSLQLLHSGASVTSLPVSESEDDLQSKFPSSYVRLWIIVLSGIQALFLYEIFHNK